MDVQDRLRGVAVGAAVGDALGMPLEFGTRVAASRLVRNMQSGRLRAGAFTDDTEMALALADSLLERYPLDPDNLAQHFVAWFRHNPPDVGIHTSKVLTAMLRGESWQAATAAAQASNPDSASNGTVMRCWPIAIAYSTSGAKPLIEASRLQSRVTHTHPECVAGCALVNLTLHYLLRGLDKREAVDTALSETDIPPELALAIRSARGKQRVELPNTGWVRHCIESAIWGLLTTDSFEDAVVQVVNLGQDADTSGTVAGALAGAAYGLSAIPEPWVNALHGEWPLGSGSIWKAPRIVNLADRLVRG